MPGLTALDPSLDGLEPQQRLHDAARTVLEIRLGIVARLLERAGRGAAGDSECVHQLRVATRRASAALDVFGECLPASKSAQLRKVLSRVRRAASRARQADVHRALLGEFAHALPERLQPLVMALAEWMSRDRKRAARQVATLAEGDAGKRLTKCAASLLQSLSCAPTEPPAADTTFEAAAREALPKLVTSLRAAAEGDLRTPESLHALRIQGKRLRYALEIFSSCVTNSARTTLYPALKQMQDHLGAINDLVEVVAILDELVERIGAGRIPRPLRPGPKLVIDLAPSLRDVAHRLRRRLVRASRDFLRWRRSQSAEVLLIDLARADEVEPRVPDAATEPHVPRVAAIDVGTNSIRLVVAEAVAGGGYRVIDDEKETTRHGRGLFSTGQLSFGAMKRSVRVIQRMQQIAQAYHVDLLRAVGTAAVREASNADEFIELVRHRAGVHLEMISADVEARLAHESVANAFDLTSGPTAIVDIGGGSTEIVFSSNGGIDSVHTLPLGAVRLSDVIRGGAEDALVFADLHNHIDGVIASAMERPAHPPQMLIGTGGTFTALAKILIRRGAGDATGGRFPFDLRGYAVRRDQVAALLHEMRRTPLRDRQRIPGLSPARAEIIIEGFAIVDRLMTFLCVDELRVHDGGIRDGLLIQMIDEHGLSGSGPSMASDRLARVRRLGESHRYDRRHAIQVARLSLRIFDQLSSKLADSEDWAGSTNRELLHMAALLHDIGCAIEYRRHHKHSFDLILAGKLKEFSRREILIIANVARYHRRAMPSPRHPGFARLAPADREVVRRLAAILRIADGLDRSHRQETQGVTVSIVEKRARFGVEAAMEPTENLRVAAKKSDLFRKVFKLTPEIGWLPAAAPKPATNAVDDVSRRMK